MNGFVRPSFGKAGDGDTNIGREFPLDSNSSIDTLTVDLLSLCVRCVSRSFFSAISQFEKVDVCLKQRKRHPLSYYEKALEILSVTINETDDVFCGYI